MPIDVIQWRVRIGLFHSEGAYREMKRRCGCKHQKIKIKSLVGDVSFVVAVALLAIELIRAMMSHSITVLSRLQWKDVTEFFHTTLNSLYSQWQQQDDKPSVSRKSAHRSMPNLITDLPSLTAVCIVVLHSVVRMLLLLSGDVEQNPGPEIILSVGDLPTLTNILRDAAPKWIAIGDELGFTDGDIKTLQNISQHTTGGDQSCFRELLAQWLKWAPPNHELPTLEKLASAVREAREERLAYGLTQKYQEKKAVKDHLPQSPALTTDGESPHRGHSASATGNKTSQSPETAHNRSQPSSCSTAGESHHGSDGASATGYEGSHSQDDGTDKDLSLPHLDTSGLSYEQAEALKGRLIEETKWIMLQFQNVVTALKRSLEAQKVSVVDLAIHLSTLGAFSSVKLHKPILDECLDNIKEANMGEAFWILRDYYSFFNYHIIEHLITGFCTEQDELYVQFQQYKQDFQKYCKRKCIECPVQFGCKSRVGQQKVTFTLDVNFQIYGIEELQAFRHRLAEILQVSEVTLCPCHVHPKRSIDLVFQVPTFVAEEIFPLSDEQESAMVAEGVVQLECGEYRWTKEEWIVSHSPTPLVLSDTNMEYFGFKKVEIKHVIGGGSYGTIRQAKCDKLVCAAKCMHAFLFQPNDPRTPETIRKFEQECDFLSKMRHPNIVQYLGIDQEGDQPILLMELMDENLATFLERQAEPLLYHLEVNLSHDIALALVYLHGNGIVHRDLSSNNILILAGIRAKVADFGMSRLMKDNPYAKKLTQYPGTRDYMPPEALIDPPEYSNELDCFSLGVLCIQIMSRQSPSPGTAMGRFLDPKSPTGFALRPVSEVERRRNQISLIDSKHPLLAIALDCLADKKGRRPSAQDLCDQFTALKDTPRYKQSQRSNFEAEEKSRKIIQQNETQLRQLQQLQQEKQQMQQEKQRILQEKQQMQQEKQRILQEKQRMQAELEAKTDTIQQLQQQKVELESKLRRSRSQEFEPHPQPQNPLRQTSQTHLPENQSAGEQHKGELRGKESTKLWWRVCGKAPRPVYRGSATSKGSMAYFRPSWSPSVLAFDAEEEKWSELPPYPNEGFSLVVVKDHVTGVGGKEGKGATNALLSLTGEGRNARWAKHFPPMPTARCFTSPIFDGRYLIVAGGANDRAEDSPQRRRRFSTVEVMDTENDRWYTASSLPNPYDQLVAAIANEKLYLLGGMDRKGALTHSVLVCSLSDLLQSCNPPLLSHTASQPEQQLQPLTSHVVWHRVADIPVYVSACVSLGERIIAVGGYYADSKQNARTSEVFTYNPDTNEWLVISHMPTARSFSMAVVLPNDTVMVVGGNANSYTLNTDTVEMAIFV